VKAVYANNLNATWTFQKSGGGELEFFANVINVFDSVPPIRGTLSDFPASIQISAALHDLMGPRYTAGARLRFH
jgi:outer membrane receptor protein involved in Fe transport